MTHLLCLACADVYTAIDTAENNDAQTCPTCGAAHEPERYARLIHVARDFAHYGHLYRMRYERDRRSGDINQRYALAEPAAALQFATLAIISGIVGNASWELVKLVAKRAADRLTAVSADNSGAMTIDDALLERLDHHCRSFAERLGGMDPQVRSAVVEEVIVHAITEYLMSQEEFRHQLSEGGDMSDLQERIPELLERGVEAVKNRPRPLPEDFENLWNTVPLPPEPHAE